MKTISEIVPGNVLIGIIREMFSNQGPYFLDTADVIFWGETQEGCKVYYPFKINDEQEINVIHPKIKEFTAHPEGLVEDVARSMGYWSS